ncbi:Tat (twin-arginine translocation) pathway signal sequence [Blastococcus sp. DSM 46786]|uniref:twin-arginine translocation signal domain-containing protein n=1 Tax=Blastococcus sp. DSM 46786 TaxID=1798227 RepID=UPI0008ADE2AE|nr:twin-arginine translocation signal domain-containing protein [Blastococcus sp. DSM 46786]SEK50229.1 Tat (twin-arginine translocation) pathway signal sequence [Blastococcus sp. DSM 46786]
MRTAASRRSFLRAVAVLAIGATLPACAPATPAAHEVHRAGHAGASDGAAAVPVAWWS